MNRKALVIIICMLTSVVIMAQDQDYVRPGTGSQTTTTGDKKFSIGISLGLAIPQQDFASTNVKNSFWDFHSIDSVRLQGFAKTGFHFNITLSYQFYEDFGLTLLFGSSSNAFDINNFMSAMGYPASTSSGNYTTAEYLIGPYVTLPLGTKFHFKVSGLIGLVTNNYPVIDLALNDTTIYERSINGGSGFAYSISAGLEYSVSNNINILLNVSYTGSKINYSSWVETVFITGYYPYSLSHPTDVTSMSTGILKPTIGVEFKF